MTEDGNKLIKINYLFTKIADEYKTLDKFKSLQNIYGKGVVNHRCNIRL